MTINLSNWIATTSDEEFAKRVLEQDRIHDNELTKTDISLRYGQSATNEVWHDIEVAIKQNDRIRFETAVTHAKEFQEKIFIKKMNRNLPALSQQLKKFGVSTSSLLSPPIDDDSSTKNAVANLLANELSIIFISEFGKTPSFDSLKVALANTLSTKNPESLNVNDVLSLTLNFYGDRFSQNMSGVIEPEQKQQYAPEQYNEYRQDVPLNELESHFGIDIRISGKQLSPTELEILSATFDSIQKRRAEDFALLKTLHLYEGDTRSNGQTDPSNASIILSGIFSESPHPDEISLPNHYATETLQSLCYDSDFDYLFKLMTHELAHLVENRDSKKIGGFDVPSEYEFLVESQQAHEWFAEDYSIYLTTNGDRVATTTLGHETIPHYEARLEFFRKQYPLKIESQ